MYHSDLQYPVFYQLWATNHLSQHIISALISPFAGHMETAVKNSDALVEELGLKRVTYDELLVSCDMSFFFTNVPVPRGHLGKAQQRP